MQEKSYKKATNSCKATGKLARQYERLKGHGNAEKENHNSKPNLPNDAN
jgi:hypothetical protein